MLFIGQAMALSVTGQKVAHLDSQALLNSNLQYRLATSDLAAYEEELLRGSRLASLKYNQKIREFAEGVRNNTLSPEEQQKIDAESKKLLKESQDYEASMPRKYQEKETELLTPIYQWVDQAIQEVAIENGYDAVLDTSDQFAVPFTNESTDITELVKEKMRSIGYQSN